MRWKMVCTVVRIKNDPKGASLLRKRGVKRAVGRLKIDVLAELGRFFSTGFAVHAAVFPFDAQRSFARIFGGVEGADDFFKSHSTAADAAEVPAATGVAEREVTRQNPAAAVEGDRCVFHMNVKNPLGEGANELDGVHSLPNQVARIEIETELFPLVNRFQSALGRVNVKCDFGRMHF